MEDKIYLTKEGLKKAQERLRLLEEELIPKTKKELAEARAQGDLSENAEYHANKDALAKYEGERQELEYEITHCEIIKKGASDAVSVGSKVKYTDLSDSIVYTVEIVGTKEADMSEKKISNESPIGKALLNHKKGDVVDVETPRGLKYQIRVEEID